MGKANWLHWRIGEFRVLYHWRKHGEECHVDRVVITEALTTCRKEMRSRFVVDMGPDQTGGETGKGEAQHCKLLELSTAGMRWPHCA